MERDLFLLILALMISAVSGMNLIRVIAVVDMTDRLFRLLRYSYRVMKRLEHRKPIQLDQAGWAAAETQLTIKLKEQPHRLSTDA